MPILWWIIVGLIAGWRTGKTMMGHGYGYGWDPWMDIIIGITGAIAGGLINVARCFLRPGWNDLLDPGCDSGRRNPDSIQWFRRWKKAIRLTSQRSHMPAPVARERCATVKPPMGA